jgi:glycosyltransferase involved in cell wall biosynthesis
MKIVFVSYGNFDSNSGGHVAGFANRLAERGHRVAVFGQGDPRAAADFGPVRFHAASREALIRNPPAALAFDGRPPDPCDTILHGWTPREAVRVALAAARRATSAPTVIHLEDDERILTASQLGRSWSELLALPPRVLDAVMSPTLTHPHRFAPLLGAAHAVTAIAAPLLDLASGPSLLLEPGCDPAPAPPTAEARARLLQGLSAPPETRLIVYPGNQHPANRNEVLSLYVAVQILRRRGLPVLLLRTGEDYGAPADVAYARLKGMVSRELGRLPRQQVLRLISAADLLIQPGPPDVFNASRLPSKLPEFFASGRPVILPAANLGLDVRDGVEARVSRRGDGAELADLAQGLLADPEAADAMGEAGRRFIARRLDWMRSTDRLEAFYRQTLAAARPTREAA